jgi:TPR repeat protein
MIGRGLLRSLFVAAAAFATIAAGPAEDARELMEAGREREAFQLIDIAAGQGDVDAIDYLAWFYDAGRVVARDPPRAARLYRQAAERGQRHAQWRLGVMLDTGEGVTADPVAAVSWFRRAAEQGSPNAQVSLGVMFATGRGVPRDYAEAMRRYQAAARLGAPHGFFGVGIMHYQGEGVPADRVEGVAWLAVAATLGDEDAEHAINEAGASSEMPSEALERAMARASAIAREHGYRDLDFRFENLDDPGQPQPVPNS